MALITSLEHGPFIAEALKAHELRTVLYSKLRRYYDGLHEMRYVSSKFREKYGGLFAEFADNMCRKVVDVPKSRTLLDGISATDQGQAAADDLYRTTRMDAIQRIVHRDAYLYGDAFVILWEVDAGLRLFRQRPDLMIPVYDESSPGEMLCALKVWSEGTEDNRRVRVSIYYEDRLERYYAPGKDFTFSGLIKKDLKEFDLDGEPAVIQHAHGRIPVFHWANKAGPGEFGLSELVDAIPLQDALNKSCFDMLVNGEATSLAQRYATGIDIEVKNGKVVNPFEGKGLWTTGNEKASFGQLDAGDSEKLLAVVRNWREEIGTVTGIPAYYLQTDANVPSGTALMVIEAPLRDKVTEAQTLFGNVWEDVFATALQVGVEDISANWRDTSPISLGETLDNAIKKKSIGYSQKSIMRHLGDSEEEIARNDQERSAEEKARVQTAQLLMARDSGSTDGGD